MLLEDVLSLSQCPGIMAGVLPMLGEGCGGREEEEAAKGMGAIGGVPMASSCLHRAQL